MIASAATAFGSNDAGVLRANGASLIGDDVVYFPVRHHSPACAWHLRELIRARRPSAILVEGPCSFTPFIEHLVDERARAPLAVYAYCLRSRLNQDNIFDATGDRRRWTTYFPLCDYSPELVALREGARIGARLAFIDLDYTAQCALDDKEVRPNMPSLFDERRLRGSRFLLALAERSGCRDHDELWDRLFEVGHRDVSTAGFVAKVASYCAIARADTNAEALQRDGTSARESEMAWHVRQELDARPSGAGPIVVVTGGFHTVALQALVALGVDRPVIDVSSIDDRHASLIRFSFDRLDRLNGYAAGMPSPAWYQCLWEAGTTRGGRGSEPAHRIESEACYQTLLAIAADIRAADRGNALPATSVIAAAGQARLLARLRGHDGPSRDDVLDAVRSCFVKGVADAEGTRILAIAYGVLAGRSVGAVPPGAGAPPLVRDFEQQARRRRLKIDSSAPRRITLDLYRRAEHRVTSRLLHGLEYLRVSFATRLAGPDFVSGFGLQRLQEHWRYALSPATDASLVDAAPLGATIAEAVEAKFMEGLAALGSSGEPRSASIAVRHLTQACVLGLHAQVPRILPVLRMCVSEDPSFVSMAQACSTLLLLLESRETLEVKGSEPLFDLMHAAFERCCFLTSDLATIVPEQESDAVSALMQLRELLCGGRSIRLDAELLWAALEAILSQPTRSTLIAGAVGGILVSAGRIDAGAMIDRVDGEFAGRADRREAVGFLRGLLLTAREIAWQNPVLLQRLDARIGTLADDEFLRMLPDLRLAFAQMTPRETDRLSEAVAGLYGATSLGPLVHYDLSEQEVAANLGISDLVRQRMRIDGLGAWLLARESKT